MKVFAAFVFFILTLSAPAFALSVPVTTPAKIVDEFRIVTAPTEAYPLGRGFKVVISAIEHDERSELFLKVELKTDSGTVLVESTPGRSWTPLSEMFEKEVELSNFLLAASGAISVSAETKSRVEQVSSALKRIHAKIKAINEGRVMERVSPSRPDLRDKKFETIDEAVLEWTAKKNQPEYAALASRDPLHWPLVTRLGNTLFPDGKRNQVFFDDIQQIITALERPSQVVEQKGDFSKKEFLELASKELNREHEFLKDLRDATFDKTYIAPELIVERGQLTTQEAGIQGVLFCLQKFGEIVEAPTQEGFGPFSDCLPRDIQRRTRIASNANCLLSASKERRISEKLPQCYNPVLSVLIQSYRDRRLPNDEQIANAMRLDTVQRENRGEIGWAIVGYARLKHRYGVQLAPYLAEMSLTEDDRRGLAVLAACLREGHSLATLYALTNTKKIPLQNLPYFECISSGDKPENNFMRLAITIRQNPFMLRVLSAPGVSAGELIKKIASEVAGTPKKITSESAETEKEKQERLQAIFDANDFVNIHVKELRRAMANHKVFASSQTIGQKLMLADVLEKKFLERNSQRMRIGKIGTDVMNGVSSCAIGFATGMVMGKVLVEGVPKLVGVFWKPGKVLAGVAIGGYFFISSISDYAHLAKNWRAMPLEEVASLGCMAAVDMYFGVKGLRDNIREAKEAAALKRLQDGMPEEIAQARLTITPRIVFRESVEAVAATPNSRGNLELRMAFRLISREGPEAVVLDTTLPSGWLALQGEVKRGLKDPLTGRLMNMAYPIRNSEDSGYVDIILEAANVKTKDGKSRQAFFTQSDRLFLRDEKVGWFESDGSDYKFVIPNYLRRQLEDAEKSNRLE